MWRVRVHLVMPQESLFTDQQHDAKAAVILKTRSGRLSEQAAQAIPQLVASAIKPGGSSDALMISSSCGKLMRKTHLEAKLMRKMHLEAKAQNVQISKARK
jgi:flagellar M-ring protein FliF